ncbi:cation:proton antiporter [Marivirga sp. S37H4]|uniref:Cation:proton antiporter n=1 Tax=Marivirga aurantiaca TaxID=2802615 RepID=A0A935CBU6_9BACT|nr:cation:proton antiporter [Marivirga aurantiaca]MBK6265573.1 cation:proton antiporter [Marivirga aurantiaca]
MNDLNLLIYLGLFFLLSQVFGKIANFFNAPRLVGYLISGIVFGPYVLKVFDEQLVEQMDLFTEMALAIIAFSIGASLRLEKIKSNKKVILGITLTQALLCTVIVAITLFAVLYFFYPYKSVNEILSICVILGAISAATAPAAVLSLIHEYKAKGNLTTVLLGIIALDDAITLIFYSFALSIAQVLVTDSTFNLQSGLLEPLLSTFYAIAFGLLIGIIMKYVIKYFPGEDILLGVILGAVFFIAGIAQKFDFSHLLPIMVFAFYLENFAQVDLAKKAYKAIDKIEEPILGVFFLLAGAHLDLSKAGSAGILVLVVFIARAISKYGGTRLAANFTNAHINVKKYTGLALLPSAGVAIGLILEAQGKLGSEIPALANLMLSIVIGKTLINELISPFFVRYAFKKAGEISQE